jgi:GNAT superfamily N-acetyltransferase
MEDFRGNYRDVSSLMTEAWAENENQPLLYTPEFLRSSLDYPSATFALAPTIYEGEKPVAFVAGLPRHIRLDGSDLNLVLVTFLTVAPAYKRKGFGILLWTELVRRARAAGYDGMINYCVDGDLMDTMILGSCQRLGLPVERIDSVGYLFGMLFPKGAPVQLSVTTEHADTLMELSAGLPDRTRLARLWSREEAEWQCTRDGALIETLEAGSRYGMLTGYLMPVASQQNLKCLLVEDILWGALDSQEQASLARRFMQSAAAAGARFAVVPSMGYADTEPFVAARCRPNRRLVHAYLSIWSNHSQTGPLDSFYLDVL